jgi:hypothetical protein
MPVSADILQKQHYLAGSDKAGYHPGCGPPHALRPDCLRSLYFRTPYLWSPLFRSLCVRR